MAEDGYDEYEPRRSGGGNGLWLIGALLGLIFLPAIVIGTAIYWIMLRTLKQRPSVTATVVAVLVLTSIIGWIATDSSATVAYVFSGFGIFAEHWQELLGPILWINLAFGALFGMILVGLSVRGMRLNPDRIELEGSWEYKFEYRRTPLQLLRRRKRIQGLKDGKYVAEGMSPLGLHETTEDNVVYRYGEEAEKHTLMSGSSGSGKTITMLSMALSDIINGETVFMIDFKRSPELAGKLSAWSHEYDADFYHFVNGDPKTYDVQYSRGQSFYDPLGTGSPTALADRVLGMREYDTASEVYKNNMQQLLQVLFNMISFAQQKRRQLSPKEREKFAPKVEWNQGMIYLVYSVITNTEAFGQLVEACENTPIQMEAEGIYEQLHGKTQIRHAMDELVGQMRTIVASEYGRWMKTGDPERSINLFDLSTRPKTVVLFSLNSDDEETFAKYVGSMILADLTSVSAQRRTSGKKNRVHVYIDEFQAVNPDSVKALLEKARESRMALTLAQQSFEQIITAAESNGEAYLNAILGTCSNFIAHAGSTESTAERLSGILGKDYFPVYRSTNRNKRFIFSFNWSNRRDKMIMTDREERWIYPPKEFMSLSMPDQKNNYRSTAVVINKSVSDPNYAVKSGATARTVWMIPDDRVIGSYYEPKMAASDDDYLELVRENKILEQDAYLQEDFNPEGLVEEPVIEFDEEAWLAAQQFIAEQQEAEDPEYSDGDFSWETIDDEEEDIPTAETLGVRFSGEPAAKQQSSHKPTPVRTHKASQQPSQRATGGLPMPSDLGIPTVPQTPQQAPQAPVRTKKDAASQQSAPQQKTGEADFMDYWNNDVKPEKLNEKKPAPVRSKKQRETTLPELPELPDL